MKKIIPFCAAYFLFSTAAAFALPQYATAPTDPGVVCANCHSDGRTWVPPVTTPPPVTPPPETTPPPVSGDEGLSASFDAATGVLSIPAIKVGDQIWSGQLQQSIVDPNIFTLTMDDTLAPNPSVDPATVDPSLLARFNPKNGKFDLPAFNVGEELWRVRMRLVGLIPSPTFVVKIAKLGLGDLDEDEAAANGESESDEDGADSGEGRRGGGEGRQRR